MRGNEKLEFLRNLKCDFNATKYQKYLVNQTEPELIKLLKQKKRILKKNSLFVRTIKDVLQRQVQMIEDTILFKDVKLVSMGSDITIVRI
tara:strand:+ start:179 stop:448 length:270 start_codon:yes stop_codon:yes gene_type:complete